MKKKTSQELLLEATKRTQFTWGVSGAFPWDPSLDERVGWFDYGRLILLVWEAGSGKTTFTMLQAMANVEIGNKVAYVSYEMSRDDLIKSIAKNKAGISEKRTHKKNIEIDKIQEKIFLDTCSYFEREDSVQIFDGDTDLKSFCDLMIRLVSENYDLIIIDNLWMIGREDPKEFEVQKKISWFLVSMKKDPLVKSSFILLHHVSKWRESMTGPRGRNAVRGTGKLVDDTEILVQIWRDQSQTSTVLNTTKFIIQKNRETWEYQEYNMLLTNSGFTLDF